MLPLWSGRQVTGHWKGRGHIQHSQRDGRVQTFATGSAHHDALSSWVRISTSLGSVLVRDETLQNRTNGNRSALEVNNKKSWLANEDSRVLVDFLNRQQAKASLTPRGTLDHELMGASVKNWVIPLSLLVKDGLTGGWRRGKHPKKHKSVSTYNCQCRCLHSLSLSHTPLYPQEHGLGAAARRGREMGSGRGA